MDLSSKMITPETSSRQLFEREAQTQPDGRLDSTASPVNQNRTCAQSMGKTAAP